MNKVCIIGRPNTGKSSLFNALINENKAITSNTPGVTRDRLYGRVTYNNKTFIVIDTGGIDLENKDFNTNIKIQAELAMDEADIILFVVDGKEDLTKNDLYINNLLRKFKKKIILVINKIDNDKYEDNLYNFYELGIDEIVTISVSNRRNINKLLNLITKDMNNVSDLPNREVCRFCLIGRPNVGKSSLVNALVGNDERQIVSNIPGTTRDANDTEFMYNHKKYVVVDTAGMTKRGRIYETLDKYALIRTLNSIDDSDVCCIVLDASTGIVEQDKHIVEYALNANKALVLVVNKWDTIKDPNTAIKEWKEKIKYEFQFIPYVNVCFVSAKDSTRINSIMPLILKAYESYNKEIKTNILNNIISDAVSIHPAPSYKNMRLKVYFVKQESTCPPKIVFNVNNKGLIHFSYYRYLENSIRNNIDLEGTPIILKFKNKNEDSEE